MNVRTAKAYVDTARGQIHYRHALPTASNGHTIVMLHKSASSSMSYTAAMAQLAPMGFSCYALDMPGFGSSFDPSPEAVEEKLAKGTRWYVDVFIAALSSIGVMGLGCCSRIHLIGHHSGASLATELAATHPEAIISVSLIGAAVMTASERAEIKTKYFAPFNQPVEDGSHLIKTGDYLRAMGVGGDVNLVQREALDHIRAWKGRNQIYGAVWEQDLAEYLDALKCPIMFMCARDDVLWEYQEKAKARWIGAEYVECLGANFSLDLDTKKIVTEWIEFQAKQA